MSCVRMVQQSGDHGLWNAWRSIMPDDGRVLPCVKASSYTPWPRVYVACASNGDQDACNGRRGGHVVVALQGRV